MLTSTHALITFVVAMGFFDDNFSNNYRNSGGFFFSVMTKYAGKAWSLLFTNIYLVMAGAGAYAAYELYNILSELKPVGLGGVNIFQYFSMVLNDAISTSKNMVGNCTCKITDMSVFWSCLSHSESYPPCLDTHAVE